MPVSSQVSIPRPVVAGSGSAPSLPSINGGAMLGQIIQQIKEAREKSGLKDAIATAAPDFNPEVINNLGLTNLRTLANDVTSRNVATNERGRNIEGSNEFLQSIGKLLGEPSGGPEVERQTERNNANLIESLVRGIPENNVAVDGDKVDLFVDKDTTPAKPFDPADFSAPTTFLERLTRGLSGEGADQKDINAFQQRINNNPAFATTINEQIQPTLTPQEKSDLAIRQATLIQKFKDGNPDLKVIDVPSGKDSEGKQLFKKGVFNPKDPNASLEFLKNPDGTVIEGRKGSAGDTNINIEADPAPSGERRELVGIKDLQNQVNKITGLSDEDFTGPMDNVIGNILDAFDRTANPDRIKFKRVVRDLSDAVLRARSGAAINESEAKRLLKFVPNVDDTDAVFKAKLQGFKEQLAEMAATRFEALKNSNLQPPFDESSNRFKKLNRNEITQDIPKF